ncbi:MAG: AAA-like domain-containing protein, partial [Verrucomicrobia bacterium]|nr:AAA-like domain-containing protein [Verrucomicrobiota bacterium]
MSALVETAFYVTGGTLRHDSPSYLERQADKDLLDGLLKGEFCYVLTSRQMGKSSLMVRTATKLREKGIAVIALDLTAIGQNLTPEQWYDGLVLRIGGQLRLEDELEDYWYDHLRLSPVQRLFSALRDVVLPRTPSSLVIFVDELDVVRSLSFSTDEFFAAVRECYNRRTEDPEFNRITFCLLGVATPSDLIRDTRTTPFNIGRRIELTDFTPAEAEPLAHGLAGPNPSLSAGQLKRLLERILYWTGGHPYLTQRLCQAVAQANSKWSDPSSSLDEAHFIDSLCEALFFSNRARERDDNLIFVRERILRSEVDRANLLDLYLKVRGGKSVVDDETNALVSVLRLSGIVKSERDQLRVRNRIYHRVFDSDWVRAHMPEAELRRQEAAFRRGVLRATAIAVVVVAVMTLMVLIAIMNATEARRASARAHFSQAQARRTSGMSGHRFESLEALARARRDYTNEAALRDEAIACLALMDLRPTTAGAYALNQTNIFAIDFASKTAAEAGIGGTVTLRDIDTGKVLKVLAGRGRPIQQLHFSPTQPFLAVVTQRGVEERFEVWNWKEGKALISADHGIHARSIDFSRDGGKVAVGLRNGLVRIYCLPSGAPARPLELRLASRFPRATQVVRFDPSGSLLAEACLDDLNAQIWNVESGECVAKFYHPDRAYDLSWHPRGEFLAVACGDSSVYLWKTNQTESAQKILTGHEGPIVSVVFSHRGGLLASLS